MGGNGDGGGKQWKRQYAEHYLLQNKAYRVTIPATSVIAFVLLLVCEHFMGAPYLDQVRNYAEMFVVMMATTLSGYVAGTVVVLAFFSVQTLTGGFLFRTFVLLVASLIANLPLVRLWYKTWWKSLLGALVFSIVLGNGWSILHAMLDKGEIHFISDFGAVLPSVLVAFCGYVYFNFLPPEVRSLFFANSYDSPEFQEMRSWIKKRKGKKISSKILGAIIFEAALMLVAAAGFSGGLLESQFGGLPESEIIIYLTQLVVLMTVIALPIILAVVAYTNLKVTNPLILMAKGIEDYAGKDTIDSDSSLDLRSLEIKTGDEITVLYDSLVRSIDATDKHIERIEREKTLERNLAVAEASSKAKSSFLSNMSHEIRTPINAVLGLDEMIMRESTEEQIRNYARDIQSAGKSLLSLVNDILDFSKIEAGKMEIISVEYDLSSVVNDLVNMIAKRAEEKGLALKITIDETMPHLLLGDEIRIKQCVLNILTNAIKYTEKGSVELNISSSKIDDENIGLCIHIVDTGIGIRSEDLPALYEAFRRIEEKRNRSIEGTGLGMSITQQLLSLMGSRLEVKSEYGVGSDFFFTVAQKVVSWEPIGNYTDAFRNARLANDRQYSETFHAPDARILVVDDTPLNLTVACGLLKRTQMTIDTAESGERTLQLVRQHEYDIIFIDHRMPGMDGIETLHALDAQPENLSRGKPCIALTANAVSGSREKYMAEGFTDYLSKPIDGVKLERMVMQYLPPEKVLPVQEAQEADEEPDVPELSLVTGISVADGIRNCGGKLMLRDVAREFLSAIPAKSGEMERFAQEGDLKNLTILVHALKSSARLIGASELSAMAAGVERSGDSLDADAVRKAMPGLLSLYRSYSGHLLPLAPKAAAERKAMTAQEYNAALQSIKECMQAFDVGTADTIVSMLEEYEIPPEEAARYEKLKEGVAAADYDAVLKLL